MIQGGDILSRDSDKDNDGTGDPGWYINSEFNSLKHKRGTLSMARSSSPHSAGSQFFICLEDQIHLDGKYTIFGEVYKEDISILDIISKVPSQSELTFRMLSNEIPEDNKDDWTKIIHNTKEYYIKVPEGENKVKYLNVIKDRLNNEDKPSIPIVIKKVRVVKSVEDVK